MENDVFKKMLEIANGNAKGDVFFATREVMQKITLAGLYRGGFFNKAAFYGGTCLRLFQGLQRFSEDMDFSLLQRQDGFELEFYFDYIAREFELLGKKVEIVKKQKMKESNIESAFLKEGTSIFDLRIKSEKQIKIKIEVDVNPPSDFETEQKLLLLPYSFMTRCYSLPDLFAGKVHALLFRNWGTRVKGRDWYDFEWFVRNEIPLSFKHFCARGVQGGQISEEFQKKDLINLLRQKFLNTDIKQVRKDIAPFLMDVFTIDIWSREYFSQLLDMFKIDC